MKRFVVTVLLLSLLLGLAGCRQKAPEATGKTETTSETAPEEPVKLTIGIRKSAYVTSYDDNHYTQWLEEQTGYQLEFQYFTSGSGMLDVMVETMVDGGLELPDLIMDIQMSKETIDRYGDQGVFVDLAPYFENQESIWWQRFSQLPADTQSTVWAAMKSPDGGIYGFPTVRESIVDSMDYQVYINREWLDTLSLEMPRDPDSLYRVLKAFKEGDPNGNSEADEIALLGASQSAGGDVFGWIFNMFLYYDDQVIYQKDENGEIYVPALTDQYREALKFMRRLYDEQLLDPLSFSLTATDMTSVMTNRDVGIICINLMDGFGIINSKLLSYEALPLFGSGVINPAQVTLSTYITEDCENVDAAWKLLMQMSTEESSLIQRYGPEGEAWDWGYEDSRSVMGEDVKPQLRLYLDIWNTTGSENWRSVISTIFINARLEGYEIVPGDGPLYDCYDRLRVMWESYKQQPTSPERIFPAFGDEADIQQELLEYRNRFLTDQYGLFDVFNDKHWQNYLDKFACLNEQKPT